MLATADTIVLKFKRIGKHRVSYYIANQKRRFSFCLVVGDNCTRTPQDTLKQMKIEIRRKSDWGFLSSTLAKSEVHFLGIFIFIIPRHRFGPLLGRPSYTRFQLMLIRRRNMNPILIISSGVSCSSRD